MLGDSPITPRIMIVSGPAGDGQDAASDALAERVQQRWPDGEICRVDMLRAMELGAGTVLRAGHVIERRGVPSWYSSLGDGSWRNRGLTRLLKRLFGGWAGRRLAPIVEQFEPDLILSSSWLGSAGLAWLRRRRSLPVPVGAGFNDLAGRPAPHRGCGEQEETQPYPGFDHSHAVVHDLSVAQYPGDRHGPPDELGQLLAARPEPATITPVNSAGGYRRLDIARTGWPLRAGDAMFRHIESDGVAQQAGAIMTAVPGPTARPLTAETVAGHIQHNLALAPALGRQLVSRGRLRQPGWVTVSHVAVDEHVSGLRAVDETDRDRKLDRFWSDPLRLDRPPWQLLVLHTAGRADTTLAFKIHHALADGLSLIDSVGRIFDIDHPQRCRKRPGAPASNHGGGAGGGAVPDRRRPDHDLERRRRTRELTRILRGLTALAWHAPAPRAAMNHQLDRRDRGVLTVQLPTRQIHDTARAQHTRSSEVSLALVAEALYRSGLAAGADPGMRLRAMLPVAIGPRSGRQRLGNRTAAVSAMLPVGPMPVSDRLQMIKTDLRHRVSLGEPDAAAFVVRGMGVFPAPVHGWMSRRVYNSRFLNLLTSYIPGPLHEWSMDGNRLTAVYPVMALATGVTLAFGIIRYGQATGFGLIVDDSLRPFLPGLDTSIRTALDDLASTPIA